MFRGFWKGFRREIVVSMRFAKSNIYSMKEITEIIDGENEGIVR